MAPIVLALLFSVTTSCAFAEPSPARQAYLAALKNPDDKETFDKYLTTLPKTSRPSDPGEPFYIVDGDSAKSAKDVYRYLIARAEEPVAPDKPEIELKVHTVLGIPVFWREPKHRTFRYAVWRESFDQLNDNGATYAAVVKGMQEATSDWVGICPECGIKFEYVKSFDDASGTTAIDKLLTAVEKDDLRFYVYYEPTSDGSAYAVFARAFFPDAGAEDRTLMIGDASLGILGNPNSVITLRGVLRHEIGHILGYRHEHIFVEKMGADWECPNEIDWAREPVDLTEYDAVSVMHYDCGPSRQKGDDVFTEKDKAGHRLLYALPAPNPAVPK